MYGSFQKFANLWYPRRITCLEDRHQAIDIKIEELSVEQSPDATLFEPPAGAVEFANCHINFLPPQATRSATPDVGISMDQQIVMVSIVVDRKGKPGNIKILNPHDKHLDKDAEDAVSGWRFKPATCQGEPVPAQITIEFDMRLRGR